MAVIKALIVFFLITCAVCRLAVAEQASLTPTRIVGFVPQTALKTETPTTPWMNDCSHYYGSSTGGCSDGGPYPYNLSAATAQTKYPYILAYYSIYCPVSSAHPVMVVVGYDWITYNKNYYALSLRCRELLLADPAPLGTANAHQGSTGSPSEPSTQYTSLVAKLGSYEVDTVLPSGSSKYVSSNSADPLYSPSTIPTVFTPYMAIRYSMSCARGSVMTGITWNNISTGWGSVYGLTPVCWQVSFVNVDSSSAAGTPFNSQHWQLQSFYTKLGNVYSLDTPINKGDCSRYFSSLPNDSCYNTRPIPSGMGFVAVNYGGNCTGTDEVMMGFAFDGWSQNKQDTSGQRLALLPRCAKLSAYFSNSY